MRVPAARFVFWLALAPLVVALVSPAEARHKLSPAQRKALDEGEVLVKAKVVEGDGVMAARAMGVVDAPPAVVWKPIDDCARYSEFMPSVAETRLVKRVGNIVTCYTRIDMPFPLTDIWSETEAKHLKKKGGRFVRRWKGTKGDYRVNEGAWSIEPWGEDGKRSLVTYRIKVAPKIAVPLGLLKAAQTRTLPAMFKALRERVATPKIGRKK